MIVPTPTTPATGWDAVVLAGGRGSRLGGADKAALDLGDGTLVEHALAATAGAARVVVAGRTDAPTGRAVHVVEDPPHGGPVAGVVAGLATLAFDDAQGAPVVVVLAVDMPGVGAATLARLLAPVAAGARAAHLVGPDGRAQLALAASTPALRAALAPLGDGQGRRWRDVVAALDPVPVAAVAPEHHDVDDPADLETWRRT